MDGPSPALFSQLNGVVPVNIDLANIGFTGVTVVIDATETDAANFVFTIQGKDSVSGKYYDILASNSIVGVGTTVLTVRPGIAVVANVSASQPLPAVWRVSRISIGTLTFTITYAYHL